MTPASLHVPLLVCSGKIAALSRLPALLTLPSGSRNSHFSPPLPPPVLRTGVKWSGPPLPHPKQVPTEVAQFHKPPMAETLRLAFAHALRDASGPPRPLPFEPPIPEHPAAGAPGAALPYSAGPRLGSPSSGEGRRAACPGPIPAAFAARSPHFSVHRVGRAK